MQLVVLQVTWSSSEINNSNAWMQNFFDGSQYPGPKWYINTLNVRAVRAFLQFSY